MSAIVFYENYEVNFYRFPKNIGENYNCSSKFFFYTIPGDEAIDYKGFKSERFTGKIDGSFLHSLEDSKIVLMLMSFRLVDLLFAKEFLRIFPNTTVLHIQHGIYSDKLERDWSIGMLKRLLYRLGNYLKVITTQSDSFGIKVLYIYSLISVYGSERVLLKNSRILKYLTLPNMLLINSEEDYGFYLEKYYSHFVDHKVVPELDSRLYNANTEILRNAVLIIVQSMVEDGRYSRKQYIKEFQRIVGSIPIELAVIVKLHPRSDITLYQISARDIRLSNDFIITEYVISGYSSMMRTVKNRSSSMIFAWKYENHHNPISFEKFAHRYGRESELKDFFRICSNEELSYDHGENFELSYHKLLDEMLEKSND